MSERTAFCHPGRGALVFLRSAGGPTAPGKEQVEYEVPSSVTSLQSLTQFAPLTASGVLEVSWERVPGNSVESMCLSLCE